MNDEEDTRSEEATRGAIEVLASILTWFAVIEILNSGFSFAGAIISAGGRDATGGIVTYWLPQILFYTFYFVSARRLGRLETQGARAIVGLSWLSLVGIILYAAADFGFGRGREDPMLALAFKLRVLFGGGDVWGIFFPVLAIVWLGRPAARRLLEVE